MDILTIPEIAAILRVSVSYCYLLAKAGKLPVVRVGTCYRCTRAQLDKYLTGEWTPPTPKVKRGKKLTDYSALSFEQLTGQIPDGAKLH